MATTKAKKAAVTTKAPAKKVPAKKAPAKKASSAPRRERKTAGAKGPLERFRAICLALPEASEVEAWGHPTFRVKNKIFASIGAHDGVWSIGVKTTHEMQAGLVTSDPRFSIAAYVGKHGWVNMRIDDDDAWDEVRALVVGSYCMIAPKALADRV